MFGREGGGFFCGVCGASALDDLRVEWKVKPDNLKVVDAAEPAPAAASDKGPRGVPRNMQYLAEGGGNVVEVVAKWEGWQHHAPADFAKNVTQNCVLHTLNA